MRGVLPVVASRGSSLDLIAMVGRAAFHVVIGATAASSVGCAQLAGIEDTGNTGLTNTLALERVSIEKPFHESICAGESSLTHVSLVTRRLNVCPPLTHPVSGST